MSAIRIADREVNLNSKGYLESFDDWDREVAVALAAKEGLVLGDAHWQVIEFLRQYFTAHEMPPNARVVVKAVGQAISPHLPFTRKQLDELFSGGGCKHACRLAGLPDYYCHGC